MNIDWHGVRTETGEWKYPYINAGTGTWWTWDEDAGKYVDSEMPARGPQGDPGIPGVKGDPGRDGRDGTGVYVTGIDQSSVDGGINYINFSDGTVLAVRNGSTGERGPAGKDGMNGLAGATGPAGADGAAGPKGDPGNSVTVVDVTESDVDGGTNLITFSDGSVLAVKNGSRGERGPAGVNGVNGLPGAAGATGPQGVKGDKGDPGNSVYVVDVSESDVDGGSNLVFFSDGTVLHVRNGNRGSDAFPAAEGRYF